MSTAAPSRGGASHAPDSLRLGGLDWARRTEGRLSSRERGRLLAAVAIGQWENALGRAKLALGRLPARAVNVDLDTFSVPDSPFAREAERACDELPAALVGHSYRTDGAGLRIWDVAPANVTEVLRRYPRPDFKRQVVAMMRAEAAAVPQG